MVDERENGGDNGHDDGRDDGREDGREDGHNGHNGREAVAADVDRVNNEDDDDDNDGDDDERQNEDNDEEYNEEGDDEDPLNHSQIRNLLQTILDKENDLDVLNQVLLYKLIYKHLQTPPLFSRFLWGS